MLVQFVFITFGPKKCQNTGENDPQKLILMDAKVKQTVHQNKQNYHKICCNSSCGSPPLVNSTHA